MEAPVPEPHLWLRMPSLVQIPHALPGVVSAPLGLHKMIWSGAWLEVLTVQLLFKCVLKKTDQYIPHRIFHLPKMGLKFKSVLRSR